jgi:hypothetical protein
VIKPMHLPQTLLTLNLPNHFIFFKKETKHDIHSENHLCDSSCSVPLPFHSVFILPVVAYMLTVHGFLICNTYVLLWIFKKLYKWYHCAIVCIWTIPQKPICQRLSPQLGSGGIFKRWGLPKDQKPNVLPHMPTLDQGQTQQGDWTLITW